MKAYRILDQSKTDDKGFMMAYHVIAHTAVAAVEIARKQFGVKRGAAYVFDLQGRHIVPRKEQLMPQFEYEVGLSVWDYVPSRRRKNIYRYSQTSNDAFEACENDTDAATRAFRDEAEAEGVKIERIISVEFIEFDSPNPSHAVGYFNVTYIGEQFPEEAENELG